MVLNRCSKKMRSEVFSEAWFETFMTGTQKTKQEVDLNGHTQSFMNTDDSNVDVNANFACKFTADSSYMLKSCFKTIDKKTIRVSFLSKNGNTIRLSFLAQTGC